MEFLIYLCLIIFTTQLSVFAQHQTDVAGSKPVKTYRNIHVGGGHFEIPTNSWWNGTKVVKVGHPHVWPFNAIEFKKDIPEDSPIRLDYTIQYLDPGFFWPSWEHLFDDSVYLCDKTTNTQDASIVALVRVLLGIPGGCPVSAGHVADTSEFYSPLKNRTLYFNTDLTGKSLRILTNIWDGDNSSREHLFTGRFYFNDPDYFPIYPVTL